MLDEADPPTIVPFFARALNLVYVLTVADIAGVEIH